jgi:beta-lactamase superfamily II metal-dependent hydrolase
MAVISAGRDRRLGFPADSVVSRIEEAGVSLYTTSQSGTVHLKVQPDGSARLLRQ